MGGNSCSVGAIAGQLGGVVYGMDEYLIKIYMQMDDCRHKRYELLLRGYKLMMKKLLNM